MNYQDPTNNLAVIDSQMNLSYQISEAYNISMSLINVDPYDRLLYEDKSILFQK